MIEIKGKEKKKLAALFGYTEETLVLSCLQDHMGRAWADDQQEPSCAKIIVGDFCFLAGDYKSPDAAALMNYIPEDYRSDFMLVVPENKGWEQRLEEDCTYPFEKFSRYAMKKEKDCFDRNRLGGFIKAVPKGYEIAPLDEKLYHQALDIHFARDFCSLFNSEADYMKRGLGFCALYEGEIVCGASSYTVYDGGIEIEIATHMAHRRKKLATACASALILECLNRGIYPSWDAANKQSVALAKKLGYHFSHEYPTYFIKL